VRTARQGHGEKHQRSYEGEVHSHRCSRGATFQHADSIAWQGDPGTPYPTDRVHFGTQGQLDLGARMASKIHDKLVLP
jgi:hypothetical protein